MLETGVQDDNDAGAQMNFKLCIENNMFIENCQSTRLDYWGRIRCKADFSCITWWLLNIEQRGIKTQDSWLGKGRSCINWDCSLLPLALPAGSRWQSSAQGSSTSRGFPVGQSCVECAILSMSWCRARSWDVFLLCGSIHAWACWFWAESVSKGFSLDEVRLVQHFNNGGIGFALMHFQFKKWKTIHNAGGNLI